jgi:tRNA G26 N,N-dimethylase Trm1
VGGPLYNGPLHNNEFLDKMLAHVGANRGSYGTSSRIEGMVSVARSVSSTFSVLNPREIDRSIIITGT